MDTKQVRALVAQLKDEQFALANAIVALEHYLSSRGDAPSVTTSQSSAQVPLPIRANGDSPTAPKGSISIRQAIVDVLKQAQRPMHSTEIWEHAYARGARTTAKRPEAIVALSAYGIDGVVKVGPRRFVWHEYKESPIQPDEVAAGDN